uniref:ARAD1B13662p n=1 Tax=Blastobotrys adeninivorans TaxID=409370 RepID=A0A060T673_BLAAD
MSTERSDGPENGLEVQTPRPLTNDTPGTGEDTEEIKPNDNEGEHPQTVSSSSISRTISKQVSRISRMTGLSQTQTNTDLTTVPTEKYSVFTTAEKRIYVLMAAWIAFLSPLSSNIYTPALATIADDLHTTSTLINLTVTTYLVFQGIAPTFIGAFSDSSGRRPAYLVAFFLYECACLGLALQHSYAALLVLRCLQSAGSSGTVALAAGMVADMVTSEERGSYVGYTQVVTLLGPSLSPIIGGLLSQYLGWKSIFWFLFIFGGCLTVFCILFLPETGRKVVGNGSIPPQKWNYSLSTHIRLRKLQKEGIYIDYEKRDELARQRKLRFPNPLGTLKILFNKGPAIILFAVGWIFTCFMTVNVSMSELFKTNYGYDDVMVGVMYLPLGGAGIISTFTTGRLQDWNYRRHAKKTGFPLSKNRQMDLTNFPIERARLEIAFPFLILACAGFIGFGWIMEAKTSVAGPVVMLAVIGYTVMSAFSCLSALIVDLYRDRAATATAANNLVRCLLGAAGTGFISPMIQAWGIGWACTFMSLVWLVIFPPFLVLLYYRGQKWRQQDKQRKLERERNRQTPAKTEDGPDTESDGQNNTQNSA